MNLVVKSIGVGYFTKMAKTVKKLKGTKAKPADANVEKYLTDFSIEKVPALVTAIGAISVALAVANHLGFFLYIGPTLLMSTMNLEDFVRNSIHAIPVTLASWAIGIALSEMKLSSSAESSNWFNRLMDASKNPTYELKAFFIVWAIAYGFFEAWPIILLSVFLLVTGINLISFLRMKLPEAPADLICAVVVLATAFLAGVGQGYSQLLTTEPNSEIQFKDNTTAELKLIKITSESLIVLKSFDALQVIARRDVRKVTYKLETQKMWYSSGFLIRASDYLKKKFWTKP